MLQYLAPAKKFKTAAFIIDYVKHARLLRLFVRKGWGGGGMEVTIKPCNSLSSETTDEYV